MATTTQAMTRKTTLLPAPIVATMQGLMPHIPALLPPDISTEQFRAALYLELSGRPSLGECTPDSLRDAVLKAATYGLLPGRDCHLLPFANKRAGGKKTATYVPNYLGILLALERSGKVAKAFAHPVYTGDEFLIDYLADVYRHVPAVALGTPKGTLRFFYGCVRMKDGTTHIEVMDEAQIDAVKRRAPAHESGPWVTDYEQMARKTVLKRVAKYVRLTPELHGLLADEAEREQEDIPAERHQKNIVDLFGDGAGGYASTPEHEAGNARISHEDAPNLNEAGQDDSGVAKEGNLRHSDAKQRVSPQGRDGAAWDTLRAYQDDARLPEQLLETIAGALGTLAPATDAEAHAIAGAVLDWLSSAEAGTEA